MPVTNFDDLESLAAAAAVRPEMISGYDVGATTMNNNNNGGSEDFFDMMGLRDYYTEFSIDTPRRDHPLTMVAEAETAATATIMDPHADRNPFSSPLHTQSQQQQGQRLREQVTTEEESATAHKVVYDTVLTHDITTATTVTTQVVNNDSNVERNYFSAAALPTSSLSAPIWSPPLPSTTATVTPDTAADAAAAANVLITPLPLIKPRTLPLARKDISLMRSSTQPFPLAKKDISTMRVPDSPSSKVAAGAAAVAPRYMRKSVGDAVARGVIRTNAPDSPYVRSRKRQVETQRYRSKSNGDVDSETLGDSESDDCESRLLANILASPKNTPNFKYNANVEGYSSDAISDGGSDSDSTRSVSSDRASVGGHGRRNDALGQCSSSSSSDDSYDDDDDALKSKYNMRPRNMQNHVARHAFRELPAKCEYVNGSPPPSSSVTSCDDKKLISRLRKVALRPLKEPFHSPVQFTFVKRTKTYVPSKSGEKALRAQDVRLIKRRKICCNVAKTETRYRVVDTAVDEAIYEDIDSDDEVEGAAAPTPSAFSKFTASSLGLVDKRSQQQQVGAAAAAGCSDGSDPTVPILDGVHVGHTPDSDNILRYMTKLATACEDTGRGQVQPPVLNYAADHIDYILAPSKFPIDYINNGMIKMTLFSLTRGVAANVHIQSSISKHPRTKNPRALKVNVHLREHELELMCLSYYQLCNTDLIKLEDNIHSARLRLLALYNLNSAIVCINEAYAKAMHDFCRTHAPRNDNEASLFACMDSESLARYVGSERRAKKYFNIDTAAYASFQRILKLRRMLQVLVDSLLSADGDGGGGGGENSDVIPVEFLYLVKFFYTDILLCNVADTMYKRHWDLLMSELKIHHFSCAHTQVAIRALTDVYIAIASHTALEYDASNKSFHEYALLRHAAVSEILDGYVGYNPKTMAAYNFNRLFSHHLYACCRNLANFILEYYPNDAVLKSAVIDAYASHIMKNSRTAQSTPCRLAKSLTPCYFKPTMARYLWAHIMSRRVKQMKYKHPFKVDPEALDAMMVYLEYEYAVILSRAMLMCPTGRADTAELRLSVHNSVRDAIGRLEEDTVRNIDNVSLFEDREFDGSSRETLERSAWRLSKSRYSLKYGAELGFKASNQRDSDSDHEVESDGGRDSNDDDVAARSDGRGARNSSACMPMNLDESEQLSWELEKIDNVGVADDYINAYQQMFQNLTTRQEFVKRLIAKVPKFDNARAPWRCDAIQDGGGGSGADGLRRKHHSRCVLCGVHSTSRSLFLQYPAGVDPNAHVDLASDVQWLHYNKHYCVVTGCSVCYYELNKPGSAVTAEQIGMIAARAKCVVKKPFGLVEIEPLVAMPSSSPSAAASPPPPSPDAGIRVFMENVTYSNRGAPACHIFLEYKKFCKNSGFAAPKVKKCTAHGQEIETRKPQRTTDRRRRRASAAGASEPKKARIAQKNRAKASAGPTPPPPPPSKKAKIYKTSEFIY